MNTGVLIKQNKTDWQVGAESGIQWQEVCQDWTPYLPTYEAQRKPFETYACVTFSCLNCLETQLKQQTGKEYNFSERFTAKMSGTTNKGNTLQAVIDSIRNDGWLLEEDYPYTEGMTFEEFYKEIPQALKDKALKNKNDANWQVNYEWAFVNNCNPDLEAIKKQLKQAPLQRATSYSSGLCDFEHATMVYKIDDKWIYVYDSYEGGLVRNPLTYAQPALMKIVVTKKVVPVELPIPPLTRDLRFGDKLMDVKYLQRKLIKLGYLSKGLDTSWYGPLTRDAVSRFQWAYKVASPIILWWNKGNLVAGLTRAKLNSL